MGDDVSGKQSFTSLDGRFTIALPSSLSGYGGAVNIKLRDRTATGEARTWRVGQSIYQVVDLDISGPDLTPQGQTDLLAGVADESIKRLEPYLKTPPSREVISLNGSPGRGFKTELKDGNLVFSRTYLVKNRLYSLNAVVGSGQAGAEAAVKALDSFAVLPEAEVAAIKNKKIAEATPAPLPQEPIVLKAKTDAEDENLKGKIKSVLEEVEDESGPRGVQGRIREHFYEFNPRGYMTGHTMYDYRGNVFQITVFGYIDGMRVSRSRTISYDYNPPPPAAPPPAAAPSSGSGPPPPTSAPQRVEANRDARYSTHYEYKYDAAGNLVEGRRIRSDGFEYSKVGYELTGSRREIWSYGSDGKRSLSEIELLDGTGNVIDRTYLDEKTGSVRERYRYKYQLDSSGNWISRTVEKTTSATGDEGFKPAWTEYRTIEYY